MTGFGSLDIDASLARDRQEMPIAAAFSCADAVRDHDHGDEDPRAHDAEASR